MQSISILRQRTHILRAHAIVCTKEKREFLPYAFTHMDGWIYRFVGKIKFLLVLQSSTGLGRPGQCRNKKEEEKYDMQFYDRALHGENKVIKLLIDCKLKRKMCAVHRP